MVLDDLFDGAAEKRRFHVVYCERILEIRTYKTVWVMGHKIRKAMAERDAGYKLAGLIELDDTKKLG